MLEAQEQFINDGQIRRVSLMQQGQPLLYSQVIDQWLVSERFRDFFISCLAEVPFPAFYWETPPLTQSTQDKPFEFVQVNSLQLVDVQANPRAFHSYFESDKEIVAFPNLSGDAFLVVPTPQAPEHIYSHLAAFTREAPPSQQHALWQKVADVIKQRLGQQPLWLSTSGLGVYWVHVRLDSYPKYYTYQPYRQGR